MTESLRHGYSARRSVPICSEENQHEATNLMLKIELTRGLGWDSPALTVIETMDSRLSSVEEFARQLLKEYQSEHPESGAGGYRILDERGRRLKASAI